MNFEKDLADYAIKVSKAKYSEVRVEEEIKRVYILKNGKFESSIEEKSKGMGIRVIENGAAFASITDLSKKKIKEALKEAIKEAKLSSSIALSEEKAYKANYKVVGDSPSEEKIKEFLLNLDSKVNLSWIKSRIFFLTETLTKKYFANSDGSKIYSEIQRFHLDYNLIAKDGNKIEQEISFLEALADGKIS